MLKANNWNGYEEEALIILELLIKRMKRGQDCKQLLEALRGSLRKAPCVRGIILGTMEAE